uniref:Uncharacterized protein n=1 Tax=Acrobeloides nanus TaxID=290746 RepID=A0A914D5B7_9BILA
MINIVNIPRTPLEFQSAPRRFFPSDFDLSMPIIEEEEESQPNIVQKSLSCPASFELQPVKFRVKYLRDGRKVINGEFETTAPQELWKQLIKNSLSTRLSSTSDTSTLSDLSEGEFEVCLI